MAKPLPEIEEYQYGFRDKDVSVVKFQKGLSRKLLKRFP